MAGSTIKDRTTHVKPLQYTTRAIKSVGEDAFAFHCVTMWNEVYKINRNMIVLKSPEDGCLTLINPILLTPAGEQTLLKMGTVANIVRLGTSVNFYDGSDVEDMYYLSKFPNCQRWAPGKLSSCPSLPIHHTLENGVGLSHPDARCFVLQCTNEPEAVLLLSRKTGGNVLIAGDCLQHQVDNAFVNVKAMARLKMAGNLKGRVVVSKEWLRAMGGAARMGGIHKSMESMAKTKFHRFISTSGNVMLKVDAKRGVKEAIEAAFVVA
jgi:hypothetical protein